MGHVTSEITGEMMQRLMNEIMSRPRAQPDMMIVDPVWYDTMKLTQETLDKFQHRNWRRLKREMRKAMLLVRKRDRERSADQNLYPVHNSTSGNISVAIWWRTERS